MNVVVIVRARDEEKRIDKFCQAYEKANTIIVADGGSVDNTVELARKYPNVVLRPYSGRVQLNKGYWRNNDADHLNFLVQQSKDFNPDWVIMDDMDCVPNYLFKSHYLEILEKAKEDFIFAVRYYFWGTEEYFPQMSSPAGRLEPTPWAWRGSVNLGFIDNPPAYWFSLDGQKVIDLHVRSVKEIMPPDCLLHYSWDTETVAYKIKNYRDSGFIPGYGSPFGFAGEKLPREEWMRP